MSTDIRCPVCGAVKSEASPSPWDCGNCGLSNAFVTGFAGEQSLSLWRDSVEKARQAWMKKMDPHYLERHSAMEMQAVHCRDLREGRRTLARSGILQVDGNRLSVVWDVRANVFSGYDKEEPLEDTVQVSLGGRNWAALSIDGKVKVFGEENDLGQQNTEAWTDIRFVAVATNYTLGIDGQGRVRVAGQPPEKDKIQGWTDIQSLVCRDNIVAGLKRDGTVLVAGRKPLADKVSGWREIESLALSELGLVGLDKWGRVKVAPLGRKQYPEVERWMDIRAVAVNSRHIYGLSEDGKLNTTTDGMFGKTPPTDVVAVAAAEFCVAALVRKNEELELWMAGSINGDIREVLDACPGFRLA